MLNRKKAMLYVALSMVLGGMAGVIYVLISNSIRKRKDSWQKHKLPSSTNLLIELI